MTRCRYTYCDEPATVVFYLQFYCDECMERVLANRAQGERKRQAREESNAIWNTRRAS